MRSQAKVKHVYRHVLISPHGPNCMGLRWIALNPHPRGPLYLRSDTLAGIKALIRGA